MNPFDAPSLRDMSRDLGMPLSEVADVVRTAPLRYKKYTIRKKNGDRRAVAQPAREVKAVQYWIVEKLLPILPVHASCTSYRVGVGIKDNARAHSGGRFLLKMDFRAFFPSIKHTDVMRLLRRECELRFVEQDLEAFTRALLWAPARTAELELCIGAPSSPLISNAILFPFDVEVHEWCTARDVTYTRYADDLTFSCFEPNVLVDVEAFVREKVAALQSPRLSINEQKTVHASRRGRRSVTGIIITPLGELSVGRERKKKIRAMYHRGIIGRLTEAEVQRLDGLLAFVSDIEPGFAARLGASMTRKQRQKDE